MEKHPDLPNELPVKGYPGYTISVYGIVEFHGMYVSCYLNNGNPYVGLKGPDRKIKGVAVKKMVLDHFAPGSFKPRKHLLHKNNNRMDCSIENLYYLDDNIIDNRTESDFRNYKVIIENKTNGKFRVCIQRQFQHALYFDDVDTMKEAFEKILTVPMTLPRKK